MTDQASTDLLQKATQWWSTEIIDMKPGVIRFRGFPIEQLIGRVSFPQMIWLMLKGDLPSPEQGALLEAALVAAVDHGPQAPSIAIGRMAVTCGLPLNGAMASAINVLDDVHGGAGEQCMELYAEIARRQDAGVELDAAIEQGLDAFVAANGKIVPGFGHRFHPIDPRSPRLLELVDAARQDKIVSGRFAEIGRGVEDLMQRRKGRKIPMNIDGATAVIYSELAFSPALGRGLFILSRSVGILAHAWEQSQQGGRIKGPMPPGIPYCYTGSAPRDFR
jgi:citrate synthase